MAERVDAMPSRRGGGVARYPWDEWMDGTIWRLVQGEDFDGNHTNFRTQVFRVARLRGVKVATRWSDGSLYIQAQRNGQP